MKILTNQGYVEYARFCGSSAEAIGYGNPTKWAAYTLIRILGLLDRLNITYKLEA